MDLKLDNKVAVITGASRGIGRAIAEELAHEGMRLVIAARSGALLAEVKAACATEVATLAVDLRDETAAQALIRSSDSWQSSLFLHGGVLPRIFAACF